MTDYLSVCQSARYEVLMESHVYVVFNLKPKPFKYAQSYNWLNIITRKAVGP